MKIRFGRRRKRDAYKIDMDKLLAARINLDPVKDRVLYDDINRKIADLQAQKTRDIQNSRRITPEGRRTIGTIVGGLALMGANYLLETKGSMLTGRRSKDADNIMSSFTRAITGWWNSRS